MISRSLVLDAWSEPVVTPPRGSIVVSMDARDDDAQLMCRYADGDLSAFERLYERHKGPLFRYLLRQSRHREIAEDLFQEVWSRVIATRQRYAPLARFSTFLFSIGHNCFIDHCRRSANAPTAHSDALGDHDELLAESSHRGPERQIASQQLAERMSAALARLPAEQLEVFVLFEESGLSLNDIAEVTGVGMETAKSRLRYALAKLRRSLSDEQADTENLTGRAACARAESESR